MLFGCALGPEVDLRLQVYTYFGTFNRMILTMFEVRLDLSRNPIQSEAIFNAAHSSQCILYRCRATEQSVQDGSHGLTPGSVCQLGHSGTNLRRECFPLRDM